MLYNNSIFGKIVEALNKSIYNAAGEIAGTSPPPPATIYFTDDAGLFLIDDAGNNLILD